MGSAPSPPPQPQPPNPGAVASAQAATNVATAVTGTVLANADEESPIATAVYTELDPYELEEPQYDESAVLIGTETREIPRFKRTIAYKPASQTLFDQQQEMSTNLNALGLSQIEFLGDRLGEPFSLDSLPDGGVGPSAPTLDTDFGDTFGAHRLTVGAEDFRHERVQVIDELNRRLQWQAGVNRDGRIAALAKQGIYPGMRAYHNEMAIFDEAVADREVQAIIAGGSEQTRLFEMELSRANFELKAQDQKLRQLILFTELQNTVATRQFQLLLQLATFLDNQRERTLQEVITERATTLNELSVMIHGGQVQPPTFSAYQSQGVANVDIAGAYFQSARLEQDNYRMERDDFYRRRQEQQAMISGIASAAIGIAALPVGGPAVAGAAGSVGGNAISGLLGGK